VEDDPHHGRLNMTSNTEFVDKVCNLPTRDCQLIYRLTASEVNVNKETIRSTDLRKRKIYVRFMPHNLHDEEKLK
jgi:hypothetical protein